MIHKTYWKTHQKIETIGIYTNKSEHFSKYKEVAHVKIAEIREQNSLRKELSTHMTEIINNVILFQIDIFDYLFDSCNFRICMRS